MCAADPAACGAAMAASTDPLEAILPLLAAGDLDLRLERAAVGSEQLSSFKSACAPFSSYGCFIRTAEWLIEPKHGIV